MEKNSKYLKILSAFEWPEKSEKILLNVPLLGEHESENEIQIAACLIKVHSAIFSPNSGNSRYFSGHSKAERIFEYLLFFSITSNWFCIIQIASAHWQCQAPGGPTWGPRGQGRQAMSRGVRQCTGYSGSIKLPMPDAQSVLGWNIIIELNDDDDEVKSAFGWLWVTCCKLPIYVDPWEMDLSPGLIRFPWMIFTGYS